MMLMAGEFELVQAALDVALEAGDHQRVATTAEGLRPKPTFSGVVRPCTGWITAGR